MAAQLEDARTILRGLKREIEEMGDAFVAKLRDQIYTIPKADVDSYQQRKATLQRASETQLFYPGYYEHVVRFEGNLRRPPPRTEDGRFVLTSGDGSARIELGRMSSLFCLCLTDTDVMDPELRRFMLPMVHGGMRETRTFSEMVRLHSIRVECNPHSSLGRSPERMHELAEAGAFHFAYGSGLSIAFTKSWERTYYWLGRRDRKDVQFPLRTYHSELLAYHSLALGSDSLILGYLALYKILEYFYTSASEAALHRKMREQITSPDFVHTKPKKLRELAKTIRQFDARLDELTMLRLVLSAHFERTELRTWVDTYESENEVYFTASRTLFGVELRLDPSDATIIPNMATRIYAIRNALVHNKEGEVGRFIPYSGQEETLNHEIQLLRFLAEQLIVRTGKDLTL